MQACTYDQEPQMKRKTRIYYSKETKQTIRYIVPFPDELTKYPCCSNAIITERLRTLLKEQPVFAHLLLKDGLSHRRKRLFDKRQDIGEYKLSELIKAGYIIQTIPTDPVSLRTVARNRKRASIFCKVFGHLRLTDFTEDYLWSLHAACATECTEFNGVNISLKLKEAKALRQGIYDFLKRYSKTKPWILPKYRTNWQSHKDLQNIKK